MIKANSQTPWRIEKSEILSNLWIVRCDNGESIATTWREADADLIVEAVNQHYQLRDLVKELADALDTFIALEDHEIDLIREAREALGKEVPE